MAGVLSSMPGQESPVNSLDEQRVETIEISEGVNLETNICHPQSNTTILKLKVASSSNSCLLLSVTTPPLESTPRDIQNEIKIKVTEKNSDKIKFSQWLKFICFSSVWAVLTIILMTKTEHHSHSTHQLSISRDKQKTFWLWEKVGDQLKVEVGGALLPYYYGNLSTHWMTVWAELAITSNRSLASSNFLPDRHVSSYQKISQTWNIPTVSEKMLAYVPEIKRTFVFHLENLENRSRNDSFVRLQFETNLNKTMPISVSYDINPINTSWGVVYAALILVGLYTLIIFEVVHRTLAAVLASTASLAVLASLDQWPTKEELAEWMDVETMLLMFSMMVLVTALSDSGVFDYLAVLAYKWTSGKVWPMIDTLSLFTALLSCFLDNVTTALLITPASIRVCEVMGIDPVPVVMSMIVFSNIGGALTPVGDPPNVIITTNKSLVAAGVSFGVFIMHMSIGLLIVMACVRLQLRFMFCRSGCLPPACTITDSECDEDKSDESVSGPKLRNLCRPNLVNNFSNNTEQLFPELLKRLQEEYPIKDWQLLVKASVTLAFVVTMFFSQTAAQVTLSLGWAALLGVILLMGLSSQEDWVRVLARVEWSTLLFLSSLFILMEALTRLGMIEWIGRLTEELILGVGEGYRLGAAILLILWVSALASSFIDNIPLTTMMIRIIISLSHNPDLNLPLQPLVWALAFGACLGGNGTLIGATANIVCAGVANQHGYNISFFQFLKIGFPVMLGSVSIVSAYLMVAHVMIGWNS